MFICHKRVPSNKAAVMQACHLSNVHATMQSHRQTMWLHCCMHVRHMTCLQYRRSAALFDDHRQCLSC